MSGTPLDRSDGSDIRLIAQTGEILYEVSNKLLVERGISVQPYVEMIKIDKPIIPMKGLTWAKVNQQGVVENPQLNDKVIEKVIEFTKQGLQCLVIVDIVKHGTLLDKMLWKADSTITHQFINGSEDTTTRKKALDAFEAGKLRCLLATSILDEGLDLKSIDCLILAAGGKAKIRLLQRVGRGLRSGEGKEKLQIVDFANFTHKWLLKHSLQRLATYKAEECFVISMAK
jgi:superfamily II DNA or RNA helicase